MIFRCLRISRYLWSEIRDEIYNTKDFLANLILHGRRAPLFCLCAVYPKNPIVASTLRYNVPRSKIKLVGFLSSRPLIEMCLDLWPQRQICLVNCVEVWWIFLCFCFVRRLKTVLTEWEGEFLLFMLELGLWENLCFLVKKKLNFTP